MLRGSSPLDPPVRGGFRSPHPTLEAPHPGSGCFWMESTGYRVSLVSIPESGTQKSPCPQFTKNVEYKVDRILKTKKNTRELKNPFQNNA